MERERVHTGWITPSLIRATWVSRSTESSSIGNGQPVRRSPGGIAENLIFDWACKEGVEWMDGGTMEGGAGHAWRKLLNESACRNGRRSQFVAGGRGRDGESGTE